ncbi:MAG: hypothetical protein J6I98_07215, partial [Clostridia bacterium]|nr:hypothetical protein [Clostridia bacterium]
MDDMGIFLPHFLPLIYDLLSQCYSFFLQILDSRPNDFFNLIKVRDFMLKILWIQIQNFPSADTAAPYRIPQYPYDYTAGKTSAYVGSSP